MMICALAKFVKICFARKMCHVCLKFSSITDFRLIFKLQLVNIEFLHKQFSCKVNSLAPTPCKQDIGPTFDQMLQLLFTTMKLLDLRPRSKYVFALPQMESKMYHFQCCCCHFLMNVFIFVKVFIAHIIRRIVSLIMHNWLPCLQSGRASYFEVIFVIWQLNIDCCGGLSLSILLFLFTCKQLRSCKQLLPFYLMNVSQSLFHY